jgi:CheY-like chemotaxis protein
MADAAADELPIEWNIDAWPNPGAPDDGPHPREVLEALPAAVYITDAAGRTMLFNTVYAFAKQSGDTVTIDSEIGNGAIVRVYPPRATGRIAPSGEHCSRDEVRPRPPSRVLVVVDDKSVRTTISTLVRALDHEAIEAASGREALELLERDRGFELLIIDFAMPVMHGAELAMEARSRLPRLRVLFVRGGCDAAGLGEVRHYPVLKKPVRKTDPAKSCATSSPTKRRARRREGCVADRRPRNTVSSIDPSNDMSADGHNLGR